MLKSEQIQELESEGYLLLEGPKETLLALSRCLGELLSHPHSEADGLVPITLKPGHSNFVNTTHTTLPPHSDGVFLPEPPSYVAMWCREAAKVGGESLIVQSQQLLERALQIDAQAVRGLTKPVTVQRDETTFTRCPLRHLESRFLFNFRFDSAVQLDCAPETRAGIELVQELLTTELVKRIPLQPNQILVVDNNACLHGRDSFPITEKRYLSRAWYQGAPELQDGFTSQQLSGIMAKLHE